MQPAQARFTIDDSQFNVEAARQFRLAADHLESRDAEPFRIRAYRRGADTLDTFERPVCEIYRRHGLQGLIAIPTIGRVLALAIADLVDFGHWRWLDRVQGDESSEQLLQSLPGVGPVLAASVHEVLGIENLEDLHAAADDGRLARVPGFGAKRIRAVKQTLAARSIHKTFAAAGVDADVILDIDQEYRTRASNGELPRIAPRRFNPNHRSWLPVLHTMRNGRRYTAMFSNSARAHELGRTHDWVIIHADNRDHGQWTVFTRHRRNGPGVRTIRGFVEPSAQDAG